MKKQKIAIVYDWVDKFGGVERLLQMLHRMYPTAPLYTSFYNRSSARWARKITIRTSFMQRLPRFITKSRVFSLPFFPLAFWSLDLSKYDTVISVSSAFAKGVRTTKKQNHIAIILTPPRYLWSQQESYLPTAFVRAMVIPLLAVLRQIDISTAQQPNILFSISERVRRRVNRFYHRDSELLYPPFDVKYWKSVQSAVKKLRLPSPPLYFIPSTPFYLVVSRLEPYKNIELVLETFKRLNRMLVVVGTGTQERKLKRMASENILFFKHLNDVQLGYLYTHARALIMPQDEDFGYTGLEAQFFGCTVISYKNSGAAETILPSKTGVLFEKQSVSSLTNAIERSNRMTYNDRHESDYLRGRSWNTTLATFKKKISQTVRNHHRKPINASAHRRAAHARV